MQKINYDIEYLNYTRKFTGDIEYFKRLENYIDVNKGESYFKYAKKHYENKDYLIAFLLFSKIKQTLEVNLPYKITHMYLESFILKDTPFLDFNSLINPYENSIELIKKMSDLNINSNEPITEEESKIINMTCYELDSKIDFGSKYKGKKIETVIKINPAFIINEIIKSLNFVIDTKVFLKFDLSMESNYYQAILINYAKQNLLVKWDLENEIKKEEEYHNNLKEEKRMIYEDLTQEFNMDYENSSNRYPGTYAQDEMGFSDQDIDDAFDGDPDAYWNID